MARNGEERERKKTVSAICEPTWRGPIPRAKDGEVNVKAVMEWTERKIDGKWRPYNAHVEKVVSCPFLKGGKYCSNITDSTFEEIKQKRRASNEGKRKEMKTPVNRWPRCPFMLKWPEGAEGYNTVTFTSRIVHKDIGTCPSIS